MRVAITTDWLNSFGGAERVLMELHAMFPDAPIYTAVHDPSGLPESMRGLTVHASFLQRIPFARRKHQPFLPLMPLAFEQFDMSEYDLVLTTSSACAKGVITRPGSLNICYCYTPSRYLWDLYHEYTRNHPARLAIAPAAHWLRVWDRLAADRVDHFIAISREVSGRIARHYRRSSEVIHPPVDTEKFTPNGREPEDFYLVVGRLVGYKRIDLAIEAANRLRRRLVIVGDGADRKRLESLAGPTIEFLGRRSDEEIADLYARCRALLFPGFEDFGIAPVEAQAAGRPVIGFGRGGLAETVIDSVTGVFFAEQTIESMTDALSRFETMEFDRAACRGNAMRFERAEFRRRLACAIDRELQASESSRSVLEAEETMPEPIPNTVPLIPV
jgi:glycosyltransferase involved in cell wall biosynthesis